MEFDTKWESAHVFRTNSAQVRVKYVAKYDYSCVRSGAAEAGMIYCQRLVYTLLSVLLSPVRSPRTCSVLCDALDMKGQSLVGFPLFRWTAEKCALHNFHHLTTTSATSIREYA